MLTTIKENSLINLWDCYQQPVHSANHQADTLRLLAALDEGWQILEAANYLAHGINDEDRGFLLTLYHPQRGLTREWSVTNSSSMSDLLAFEGVPGYIN